MLPTFARLAGTTTRQAAKEALKARLATSQYPIIEKCPSPTCVCGDVPPDLDIEREKPLNNTMAAHQEQLLIATGQSDWTSKIEDERDTAPWGEFVARLKKAMGHGGEYHDPYHNVAINTCSFEAPTNARTEKTARAFLFPSFHQIDNIKTDQRSVLDFVKTFLLPTKLHPQHDNLTTEEKSNRTRDTNNAHSPQWAGKVTPISTPTIMICSHYTRDSRCGILGPLLHAEFTAYINKRHTLRNQSFPQGSDTQSSPTNENTPTITFASHPEFQPNLISSTSSTNTTSPVNIGMISHIGGHKWAGNVIVYIPPNYTTNPLHRVSHGPKPKDKSAITDEKIVDEAGPADEILDDQATSPLAGKSIWYGRVEPRHVEGIVEMTLGKGLIIAELFRGGVNADGSYLRI